MGICCASDSEIGKVDNRAGDMRLTVWGDIVNAQVRTTLTMLSQARIPYQFQQVNSPIEESDVAELGLVHDDSQQRQIKRDFLERDKDSIASLVAKNVVVDFR